MWSWTSPEAKTPSTLVDVPSRVTMYPSSSRSSWPENSEVFGACPIATKTPSTASTDVVPVYVHQPVSAVLVPDQRLVGFTRVTLNPGQSATVHVAFPVSALAVTPGDISGAGSPQVELGSYQVQIGTPASLTAGFTVG